MLALLLVAFPVFDSFDGPLDPARWFVGAPGAPGKGELRLRKGAWIAARGLPDAGFPRLEVDLGEGGGELEITFHDPRDPLGAALGEAVRARARGAPTVSAAAPSGAFRLRALSGDVVLREVRVEAEFVPPRLSQTDQRTVFGLTTPERYGDARRAILALWDVELAVLVRRGAAAGCEPVRGPLPNCPVLAVVVTITDGAALAQAASGAALAQRDWSDERGNLAPEAYRRFLAAEYALLETLESLQRALNAVVPDAERLEALVPLAAIRHADAAHAALSLAETRGAKRALEAMREVAGKGADLGRLTGDALRENAAAAAAAILRQPPSEWPGFRFEPAGRHAALARVRDLLR